MLICTSCCFETNYRNHFEKFEKAASILNKNKAILSRNENSFNVSRDEDFIFLAGRREFAEIIRLESNTDLEDILSLWDENLIENEPASLWLLKNGNVYFLLDKCQNGYNYLVYDGGEEIEIDVSDDNIKERIKSNWVFIRMR